VKKDSITPPIISEQAERLADKYPGATLGDLGNGTFLCTIPRFRLPEGWSKGETTVCFIVPNGYPQASPAYFWTDADLMLESGGTPSKTDLRGWTGIPDGMRWWSWTPSRWSPNRDTLITYAKFIMTRFLKGES
jgi:hypothetical protein